jgi:hypothetical protein
MASSPAMCWGGGSERLAGRTQHTHYAQRHPGRSSRGGRGAHLAGTVETKRQEQLRCVQRVAACQFQVWTPLGHREAVCNSDDRVLVARSAERRTLQRSRRRRHSPKGPRSLLSSNGKQRSENNSAMIAPRPLLAG